MNEFIIVKISAEDDDVVKKPVRTSDINTCFIRVCPLDFSIHPNEITQAQTTIDLL